MYASKRVGQNKVIPVADRQELSEENIQVAAVKYIAGEPNPLDTPMETPMETPMANPYLTTGQMAQSNPNLDTPKTVRARREAIKFVHKKDEMETEVASPMNMYLRVKQMSLFPSIY
jgi:hypothetical protein